MFENKNIPIVDRILKQVSKSFDESSSTVFLLNLFNKRTKPLPSRKK